LKKPSRRRTETAYHEAGHAVIGRVLTLMCGEATIKPDYRSRAAGFSICQDPYACLYEWEKRGKVRDIEAVWHARIIWSMAGAEAQRELLGDPNPRGDDDDRRQIGLMMEEVVDPDNEKAWEKTEARLRAMTRMLVRRHRARIERVAKALLAKTTLSAEELDKLVGRSVNDVKVNAPFLLEMHRRHTETTAREYTPKAEGTPCHDLD
jgi:phage baseplate assembly protein W